MSTTAAAWGRAERILCVRLDTVGDVLMSTPAIRALREPPATRGTAATGSADDRADSPRPSRHITLLTSAAGAAVARLVPEIDEVLTYEAPWMKASGERTDAAADHAMIERLRGGRFDAAAIFTVYSQDPLPAAFMTHLAGIPLRLAHSREKPYGLLTQWVPETEPGGGVRHEVRRQLDLVATVGGRTVDERLSLRVPDDARREAEETLRAAGLAREGPWAVLHPGATAPSRRYPPELWADVGRALAAKGWKLALTGGTGERALVEGLRRAIGPASRSLAGATDLTGLAAILERAPLLLCGNTGPVHMAAALGTPVVDLYALTNPQHTPWMVASRVLCHDVPCRWCQASICPEGHHRCLRGVAAAEVVAAALDLHGRSAGGGEPPGPAAPLPLAGPSATAP